jgi:hypothetical protein
MPDEQHWSLPRPLQTVAQDVPDPCWMAVDARHTLDDLGGALQRPQIQFARDFGGMDVLLEQLRSPHSPTSMAQSLASLKT